jgi:hypothetical protein
VIWIHNLACLKLVVMDILARPDVKSSSHESEYPGASDGIKTNPNV